MAVSDPLSEYPVTYETPVAWGEMDAFQHVNNATYFRYFESARLSYFMEIGISKHMQETGIGPILASTSCRFKRPLTYPDQIVIGATITEVGTDRFTMRYRIVSHTQSLVAAEGEGLIVFYDYNQGIKTEIPETIRAQIDAL